jgi:hypothetical protein
MIAIFLHQVKDTNSTLQADQPPSHNKGVSGVVSFARKNQDLGVFSGGRVLFEDNLCRRSPRVFHQGLSFDPKLVLGGLIERSHLTAGGNPKWGVHDGSVLSRFSGGLDGGNHFAHSAFHPNQSRATNNGVADVIFLDELTARLIRDFSQSPNIQIIQAVTRMTMNSKLLRFFCS